MLFFDILRRLFGRRPSEAELQVCYNMAHGGSGNFYEYMRSRGSSHCTAVRAMNRARKHSEKLLRIWGDPEYIPVLNEQRDYERLTPLAVEEDLSEAGEARPGAPRKYHGLLRSHEASSCRRIHGRQ